MKFKFRADKEDLIIFGIFCVILLYLIAIAILNIVEFVGTGFLWGFNPLPAFGPDYIVTTISFFFFALIGIIASAKNYFFEREKGIGLKVGKKEKSGYSRWAKESEIKKELKEVDPASPTSEYAGVPLVNNGKKIWVDDGEYHSLIIGSTGSGKTQTQVQPLVQVLAKKGESMIVTDPKGEIYRDNGVMLKERGYNIVILNFRDPQNGNAWNPLTVPYNLYKEGNSDKSGELLEDLGKNILYEKNASDPFWGNSASSYFAGLGMALVEDAKPEEVNINSINAMSNQGAAKCGPGSNYIKEYFKEKDPNTPAYVNAQGTVFAPNETQGGILATFNDKIRAFAARENISEMLSYSDFDMKDIGRKKTAVFIVVQDEKSTYHSLATIFIKQCYETLIDVAQTMPNGKLPYRTNFILDEFANMPPINDIGNMISAARSRNIRFDIIIQNFSQLDGVYGSEVAETIKGNCGNIIYLISSELKALEEISKLCGEKESKKDDKTASTPLVTVSDLQRLPQNTLIVLRLRKMPFKTKVTPYWKMNKEGLWGKIYPTADFPVREKKKVNVFKLKEYVDSKRKEKMNGLFGNMPGPNPNAGLPGGGGLPLASIFGNDLPGMSKPEPRPKSPLDEIAPGIKFPSSDKEMDEILKRIDAKIAELDEEQRKEDEKLAKEKAKPNKPKEEEKEVFDKPVEKHDDIKDKPVEKHESIKDKPVEKIKSDKLSTEKHNDSKVEEVVDITDEVTDDQFFDDFFSDDDE